MPQWMLQKQDCPSSQYAVNEQAGVSQQARYSAGAGDAASDLSGMSGWCAVVQSAGSKAAVACSGEGSATECRPIPQCNVQGGSDVGAGAVYAVGHGICGAGRDVAQAHAGGHSCHVTPFTPQHEQAIHHLLE